MMRIITNPTKSVGSNTASVHATAEIVAITGSLVPSMVARIEDAHHAGHVQPERAECAADHGERHQPHTQPIQLRRRSPRPHERQQHKPGNQERDAIDGEVAPTFDELDRKKHHGRRGRRVDSAPNQADQRQFQRGEIAAGRNQHGSREGERHADAFPYAGSRRPRRHTTPKTNSRFRLCSTVAVPELVQLIDSR